MGLSAAERQKRYRAHKRGDHTLCDPDRDCRDDVLPVPSPVTGVTRNASRLGVRGQRLWDDMGGAAVDGGRRVVLEEACRIADRLDGLHRLLDGDAQDWLDIVDAKGNPDRQELVIDRLLAEARQQATVLKQLVAELRQSGRAEGDQEQGGSILDQLAAQREKRLANAAGS
ncbi:hypothetical protein OHB44_27950 [Micromonospora sp. NBC_00821]|uniref:hypothetical protein n=1 Tax=Micromonospora sp. NBC_00821 TaxID=2975977 RepID=UPI002ED2B264|nr:hypothetical protein OHB44_27950 [Micromonospora sp. NBC_00821]